MFERDDEIQAAVDRLFEMMVDIGRGGILTHDAIRGATGLEPHRGRWDHIVNRARARLQGEHGIATWVRPEDINIGYRLLTVMEQHYHLPQWRSRRAARHHRRSYRSVAAIPDKELSLNQQRNRNHILRELREAERACRRTRRHVDAIAKGQFVVPRMPDFQAAANR